MVQIPGPGLKVDAKPRGCPGGCWRVELTDALLRFGFILVNKFDFDSAGVLPAVLKSHKRLYRYMSCAICDQNEKFVIRF